MKFVHKIKVENVPFLEMLFMHNGTFIKGNVAPSALNKTDLNHLNLKYFFKRSKMYTQALSLK